VQIPWGYQYSAQLGDRFLRSGDVIDSNRFWNESLRYTMDIDSSNAFLLLKYALVLEEPTDLNHPHTVIQEPRFKLTLFDQGGNILPDCANYDVYAIEANGKGFQIYQTPDRNHYRVHWRDWTSVGVKLLKYIGQSITIEFMVADCTLGGHGAHAYFASPHIQNKGSG